MKSWLYVGARDPRRGSGVNGERYSQTVHELVIYINNAVERCFDGPPWLKLRFGGKGYVQIQIWPHPEDVIKLDKIRTKTYNSAAEVICPMHIPASWFDVPGDGLLAIRLFRAVLFALQSIGDRYEIGPPPLRSRTADPGRPELLQLFSPREDQPSPYAAAALLLQQIADRAEPDQLVLAAHEPASQSLRVQQKVVAQSLGTTQAEHILSSETGGGKVRVWTNQQDS
ncbi:MAG TPA: hypothetical protein VFX61_15010 [Micromonosporaceae bacterium]|nr:hypothetical protein [Micromonosporaceae bacterium]